MTPAARIKTTIDLWGLIEKARIPMDSVCGDFFRTRRFIGSKDRADIAERIYTMMRWYGRYTGVLEKTGHDNSALNRVLFHLCMVENKTPDEITALFTGSKHEPDPLDPNALDFLKYDFAKLLDELEQMHICECPEWAYEKLKKVFKDDFVKECEALIPPASLNLRVNTVKSDRQTIGERLAGQNVQTRPCQFAPDGLIVEGKAFLSATTPFRNGQIEIQDEGSQLIAAMCDPQPGQNVYDYCAGAGGKTLALAALMNNKGRIVASDIDPRRLMKSKSRFKRADIHNVETRPLMDEQTKKWLKRQKQTFDTVLVDVPCTSSGTWRRNPDLRWHRHGPSPDEIQALQADIIEKVTKLVKPGGRLVYATCSLFAEENEEQVMAFLEAHPEFELITVREACNENIPVEEMKLKNPRFLRLSPAQHGTDGFFAACLIRKE